MSDIYIPLHVHSEYSFLDGLSRIPELVKEAKRRELPALGISDHNITGIVDFYFSCKKEGILPILGVEMYLNDEPGLIDKTNRKSNHLLTLAMDYDGYRDLLNIYSEAATKYFYYHPRTSIKRLGELNTGHIIASNACLGGRIPKLLVEGRDQDAEEVLNSYKDAIGDENFFIELMPLDLPDQVIVNAKLYELAKKTKTPMIITTDAHYLKRKDAQIQKILMKVATLSKDDQNSGKIQKKQKKGLEFETDMCWLMTYDEIIEEMEKNHPSIPKSVVIEALENTVKISERCKPYEIASDTLQVPNFELPPEYDDYNTLLRDKCWEMFPKKFAGKPYEEYAKKRLEFELDTICSLKYSSYFLIVQDLINYARKREWAVGPGRGSAAGCVVSYLLGIVRIDPVRWGLHFERFLNPERAKPPDIDIDFCSKHRDEVIEYIQTTYGEDKVAQIITYSKLGVKSALKDLNRVMGVMDYDSVNAITKIIPYKADMAMALEIPAIARAKEDYPELFEIVDRVTSMPRNPGKHPAGVVVTPRPIQEYAAIAKDTKMGKSADSVNEQGISLGIPVLQLDMGAITKLNLLKIDCLAISGLDLIEDTFVEIYNNWGKKIDWDYMDNLNLNDPVVYKMIKQGKTNKVFQLGSQLFKNLARQVKPEKFEDLIALIALGRPGSLSAQLDKAYVENKKDISKIKYLHPSMASALDETFGIILYQEQVMEVYSIFSGIKFGVADLFRRHLEGKSKGDPEKWAKEHAEWEKQFIDGAVTKGHDKDFAKKAFDWLVKGSGYLFNKSHSTSYAINAYHTAWLKAYYFVEFMTCTLRVTEKDKIEQFAEECYSEGYPVLPVDVNHSKKTFSCEGNNAIRVGFSDIKGVGEAPAIAIINNLQNIPGGARASKYKDMVEFFYYNKRSMGTIRKTLKVLAGAGAFDTLVDGNRKAAESYVDMFLKMENDLKQLITLDSYQECFDMYLRQEKKSRESILKEKDYSFEKKASLEKDLLGFKYKADVKPKNRKEPKPEEVVPDKQVVKNSKLEKKEDKPINNSGGLHVELGKHDAKIVSVKATEEGNYEIALHFIDSNKTKNMTITKKKAAKYRNLLKKEKKIIVEISKNEEGKSKIVFLDCEEDSNKEQKTALNETQEKEQEEKSDPVEECSPQDINMGVFLLHIKNIPAGSRLSLIRSLSNGVENIDEYCKDYYIDLYLDEYESFLKLAKMYNGNFDTKKMIEIEGKVQLDERYADFGKEKVIQSKTKDELIELRITASDNLKKLLKKLDVISKKGIDEDIRNIYKRCIKAERTLERIERSIVAKD